MVLVASNSYAAVKAGSACPKLKMISISGGKVYTCIKSGKKLVWDKGVVVAKPSVAKPTPAPSASAEPTPAPTKIAEPVVVKVDYNKTFSTDQGYYTDFTGPCQFDNSVTGQLAEIQTYFYNYNRCAGQIRVNKYELGKARPKETFDSALSFSNTEPCKIATPKGVFTNRGFTTAEPERNQYDALRKFPSPGAVVQLIPIYASDTAEPKNSPAEDYGAYLKLVKDWIEYSTDFGSSVEVRIPASYIKMNKNLGDYQIFHENRHDSPNHVAFNKDLVAATDPVLDYRGANIAIVVAPAGTESSVFGQASIGSLQTNEGFVALGMSQYAHLATTPSKSKFSNLGHPFWWIHEMFHSGVGFDDHYGDTQQNINTEYGMGHLTMMTPFGGDLTTWEKWRLGFMKDSQVQCISSSSSSTHWIAPSTVQTSESKAIVIRISATRAVVVETLRPSGLYYKLPLQSQGALVYEVDVLETGHGLGYKLSLPIGRSVTSDPFFMASYPLKQGESTICNGYKITIVESGTFGDVVKVDKV
ncbi:hypothetical protein MCERE3_00486 [Candidatus Nanopelagicaceae bacterium]